jgi:hypothetical protein
MRVHDWQARPMGPPVEAAWGSRARKPHHRFNLIGGIGATLRLRS